MSNPVMDGHDVRSPTFSIPRDFASIATARKIIADPPRLTNRPGDRAAAEGGLERNLLANGFISLFTEETSSSTIKFVTHNFQRTAILRFPKLALCPWLPFRVLDNNIKYARTSIAQSLPICKKSDGVRC